MNYTIRATLYFDRWLHTVRDPLAKAVIVRRTRRAETGNFGDHHPVGGGVSEMRIDVGAGYRVYHTIRGLKVVFLLCGWNKRTQESDIELATRLAQEISS